MKNSPDKSSPDGENENLENASAEFEDVELDNIMLDDAELADIEDEEFEDVVLDDLSDEADEPLTDEESASFEYSEDEEPPEVEAQDEPQGEGKTERLQKLIARAGIASRRAAEELISSGKVSVNGHVIKELGAKADPSRDRIVVKGKPLVLPSGPSTVVVLHKPIGVMTTRKDPEGRPTVLHYLPTKLQHLHPAGRLDYDTSGVLLLTDDGELTQLLTHPSHGVEKVYWARVSGVVTLETVKKLEQGVYLTDGKTAPCRVRVRAQTEKNALVQIALREGRNRQVRRMFDAVGHSVKALRRVRFAGLGLNEMPSGGYRILLPGEVHALRKAAEKAIEKAKAAPRRKPKPRVPLKKSSARKPQVAGSEAGGTEIPKKPKDRPALKPRPSKAQDPALKNDKKRFAKGQNSEDQNPRGMARRNESAGKREFPSRDMNPREANTRDSNARGANPRDANPRDASSYGDASTRNVRRSESAPRNNAARNDAVRNDAPPRNTEARKNPLANRVARRFERDT